MSTNFGATEKSIESLFVEGKKFFFEGVSHEIIFCGKPKPSKGECKTDLYILASTPSGKNMEFKISIKQDNADFLENKIKLSRAVEIFGDNAQELIANSTVLLKKNFEDEPKVYFKAKGRTEQGCITLGWKFELLNVISGSKSGILKLTEEQKVDIYAGTNLNQDKKDCFVKGKIIKNSGVANFILIINHVIIGDLQQYVSMLIPIEAFAKESNIFFACKALNYRIQKNKWDGDRPLAVYVDWKFENNMLTSQLIFNTPLKIKGNEIGENIRSILKRLKIVNENFSELRKYLHREVKIHE